MIHESPVEKGSCLCGSVRYEVHGKLRPIVACHCTQCRKSTGHFMAATAAKRDQFVLVTSDQLEWFKSSNGARRGFCRRCGSTLFWEGKGRNFISIAAGTLDTDPNIEIVQHIYTANKGCYYSINDNVPQSLDGEFNVQIPD